MTQYHLLSLEDIESLAVGAWILGTGGGGSPHLGLLNMRQLYAHGKRIRLMPPEALDDGDSVAVVSNQGAPLVGQERLTDSRNVARAVALMEEITGNHFRAIMSLEIGGGNSIQLLMAAAHLDRPVVDADCMGRVYPEAQMTSFAVGGLQPYPLTSVDPRGGESEVLRVTHGDCANAVGAAIAQVSGEVDQIYRDMSRGDAIKAATQLATDRAVTSGADKTILKTIETEDMPLSYLPGKSLRVRVRMVGDVITL